MQRLRVFAIATITTIVAAASITILGRNLYVDPQIDQLRHADAILVLGGHGYQRYDVGIQLAVTGWSRNLVISNPNGEADPWLHRFCRREHPEFDLFCFVPDPRTTRGEAREFERIASRQGWHSVIVVTFRPHVSRARYIVQRCFAGEVIMVASPTPISQMRWLYEYAYQTLGFVRALALRGC